MTSTPLAYYLFAFLALGCLSLWRSRRAQRTVPPGPRGWPLIGNMLDMPASQPWRTFADWSRQYGNVVQISLLGQPMVILGSRQAAVDTLQRKSALYSDRPRLSFLGRAVGWDRTVALLPYGSRWSESRRLYMPVLGSRATVVACEPVMNVYITRVLARLRGNPDYDQIIEAVTRTVASTALVILYGYSAREEGDPMVEAVKAAMAEFSAGLLPGARLVDVPPALKRLPARLLGSEWKAATGSWRADLERVLNGPYEIAKQAWARDKDAPSFVAMALGDSPTREHEELVRDAACSAYVGNTDSTISAMGTFCLAMSLYPEAQRKAQAEIDRVVGADRLPLLQDMPHLPYVRALILEVLRWSPPIPLGMPHRLQQDDVYDGYLLKEGTIVVANIWQMLHDPETYSDPFAFNPDRHLATDKKPAELDPREVVWGFGRRSCPGLYLGETCLSLGITQMLATYSVSVPEANAARAVPNIEYTTGTVSRPVSFPCTIIVRSPKAEALVRSVHLPLD